MAAQFFILRAPAEVVELLSAVCNQADGEREALGFLPEPAYAEYAQQRKLIVLVSRNGQASAYVGHLLFGGMFPHLRILQIAVSERHRKQGHATTLLRALISQAEKEGYLSISANVAADLLGANSFYESCGFAMTQRRAGGASRGRTINVRVLELETPSLLSLMKEPRTSPAIELLTPTINSQRIPLYAIDLNIFFDAIRDRPHSANAGELFAAALGHQIRLATSQEFVTELKRTSTGRHSDPVLSLARQIPCLPPQDQTTINTLVPLIAEIVFPERARAQRLLPTDKSDVLHIAHAIAAGAQGYITRDSKVLAARDDLMAQFRLDVIGLSEFVDLIRSPTFEYTEPQKRAKNFIVAQPDADRAETFFRGQQISVREFFSTEDFRSLQRTSITDANEIIGVSLLRPAAAINEPSRTVVCVQQEHPYSSTVADFLISEHVRFCSRSRASRLLMMDIPSHPITRRIALSQGFQKSSAEPSTLAKIALGHAITRTTWGKARLAIERLAGLKLPRNCPRYDKLNIDVEVSNGQRASSNLFDLETLFSPTIFALAGRPAVIVPITRVFASDLLGTDDQFSLLELPEAQFISRRTYFNATRAMRAMIRGAAIAFYESSKKSGRGAIVAVGRIVDVTSVTVGSVPERLQRGAVVENPKMLTKSSKVLATTFDNLIVLRTPVTLARLREIGCTNKANFVSATPISPKHLQEILEAGGSDG